MHPDNEKLVSGGYNAAFKERAKMRFIEIQEREKVKSLRPRTSEILPSQHLGTTCSMSPVLALPGIMIDFQRKVLGDDVRNSAFEEALKHAVQPGMTVVDIGAGTGYLSFLARKLGAKECILIEQSAALRLAKKIARENKITGCTFLDAHSIEVNLPPTADIVFSETLGNFALEEHILENLMDAKRFLKSGGTMIPQGLKQFVAPIVRSETLSEIDVWRTIRGGLNFESARSIALQNLYVGKVREGDLLKQGTRSFDAIDFQKKESSVRKGSVEWDIEEDVTIYGFGAWWECTLVPGVILSTSPASPETHWEQIVLPILQPLECRKGDHVRLQIASDTRYRVGLRVRWVATLLRSEKVIVEQAMDNRRGA
jgi:protein arginine N-methyltransferase 1